MYAATHSLNFTTAEGIAYAVELRFEATHAERLPVDISVFAEYITSRFHGKQLRFALPTAVSDPPAKFARHLFDWASLYWPSELKSVRVSSCPHAASEYINPCPAALLPHVTPHF